MIWESKCVVLRRLLSLSALTRNRWLMKEPHLSQSCIRLPPLLPTTPPAVVVSPSAAAAIVGAPGGSFAFDGE